MNNYKFTEPNGCAYGGFTWPLPSKNADGTWTPGEWVPEIDGELVACENGYHYADGEWVTAWIDAEMYEIEVDGETITSDNTPIKHVCRRARLLRRVDGWNDRTARLFAVRCARDAMSHVENPDPRSVAAIDTAERYANGLATREELAAARAVARAAAWDFASAAARDSASAAARDSAWAAAWDSASAAALQKYSNWLLEVAGEVTK